MATQTLARTGNAPTTTDSIPEWLNLEWWTVAEACKYSRGSKGWLYSIINAGLIRTMSQRKRGQMKGKRLISSDSLKNFLRSHATGGESPKK